MSTLHKPKHPRLVGPGHSAEYTRNYWTAVHALAEDFRRTLRAGAYLQLATPYDKAGEERALVQCVAQQMDREDDLHTLNELLCVLQHAADAGDAQAKSLIERLALAHAQHYASSMGDQGDLTQ